MLQRLSKKLQRAVAVMVAIAMVLTISVPQMGISAYAAAGTDVLDFNGTDFGTDIYYTGSYIESVSPAATLVTDTTSVPEGFTGSVYVGNNEAYVATAVEFQNPIDLSKVTSVKLRMYVSQYTPSKAPELRIFNGAETAFVAATSPTIGAWSDIEIFDILNGDTITKNADGDLERFVIGYRSRGATNVYFDNITIEYSDGSYSGGQIISEMSVSGVENFTTANGRWDFILNMNGTWPTTGDWEAYASSDITATIKDASGTILAEISTAAMEHFKSGTAWYVVAWGAYTANNVPAEGDTITISSGQLTYSADANKIVNVTEETVLEYNGTNWSIYVEKTMEDMSVSGVANFTANTGADWCFNLNMEGTWPTTGSFDEYTSADVTVEIKNAAGEELATVSGGALTHYKNESYWRLAIWGNYTANNTPAQGDIITISSGQLTYSADANKIVNVTEATVLEYNGTNWSIYVEKTVEDMSVSGVANFTANTNADWCFNLNMDGTWPTTGSFDEYTSADVTVEIKNATGEVLATVSGGALTHYKNESYWRLAIWGNYTSSNVPAQGDIITISSGQLIYSADTTKIVNINEEAVFEYNNGAWVEEGTIIDPGVNMTITAIQQSQYNAEGHWRFWLKTSETLPLGSYSGIEVEVNGAPYTGDLSVINDADMLMIAIWGMTEQEPAQGTKVTIKAGTAINANGNITLSESYTMEYNDGSWTKEGMAVHYQQLTFDDLNVATGYNEEHGWFFYIVPSTDLPGTGDKTSFSGLKVSINDGEKFLVNVTKANHEGTAFVHIPKEKLAEKITENTKLVFHSGKAGSNDGSDGIHLTKDFAVYMNQYGISVNGFVSKPTMIQTDAVLTLDTDTAYGGNERGIYVNTTDKFPVDTTWATRIRAASYDENSGVFLNGEKLNAPIIRYAEGKAYIGLVDADVQAKDKDKLTIRGTFTLGEKGVSYKEVSFYYNGKTWGTTYEEPKPETYKKIAAESVNTVSKWNEKEGRWDVYLNLNAMLPGEIDKISFQGLAIEINGKEIATPVYHSYQHTLFFPIWGTDLDKNCKDGIEITLKAGKALAGDKATGIELTKDFKFYTYKGSLSEYQPTTNTSWEDVTITSMLATGHFNDDAGTWNFHLNLRKPLATESGTVYLQLPVQINGKTYYVKAQQDGEYLYITIPESILPGTAKKATIVIEEGAKGYANAGRNGIKITDTWTTYLFNGAISEHEFTEIETTETRIIGLQNATPYSDGYHVYLRLNKECPGSAWYEKYNDFEYYYNNQKITCMARKSESSNNKFIYFPIETSKVGTPKEGDVVTIKGGLVITCGGYEIKVTNDFMLMYTDGVWSQYMETDVKAPADDKSLWEIARFDKAYIPFADNGSVMYSNEDKYNTISSLEPMKDFTISFNVKKMYDDELSPSFGVILRGNAVSENEEMTKSLLYGYVITFSALEKESEDGAESTWTGYLNLWKNGENYSLLDQYRISYVYDESDHPYFQYEEDYKYEFSIYNVTETCVCITAKVNDKLVMRYYDEAGSDPFDPAVNAGTFQVYAGCPNYITDDIVELDAVISEQDECQVGKKVRVAATYPSVLEGAEFTVDKDGATVEDGIFMATKPGTYTVSCTYNGQELKAKTITVTEAEVTEVDTENNSPLLLIAAITLLVIVGGVVTVAVVSKKRKKVNVDTE